MNLHQLKGSSETVSIVTMQKSKLGGLWGTRRALRDPVEPAEGVFTCMHGPFPQLTMRQP